MGVWKAQGLEPRIESVLYTRHCSKNFMTPNVLLQFLHQGRHYYYYSII